MTVLHPVCPPGSSASSTSVVLLPGTSTSTGSASQKSRSVAARTTVSGDDDRLRTGTVSTTGATASGELARSAVIGPAAVTAFSTSGTTVNDPTCSPSPARTDPATTVRLRASAGTRTTARHVALSPGTRSVDAGSVTSTSGTVRSSRTSVRACSPAVTSTSTVVVPPAPATGSDSVAVTRAPPSAASASRTFARCATIAAHVAGPSSARGSIASSAVRTTAESAPRRSFARSRISASS